MHYVITYVNITEEKHYHYVIVILNIGGNNPCPDTSAQTDRSATGVAIFSHCGKKPASPLSSTRTHESALSTGSSRRVRSKTYEDEEDSKGT